MGARAPDVNATKSLTRESQNHADVPLWIFGRIVATHILIA
jgi:hypothetical protein